MCFGSPVTQGTDFRQSTAPGAILTDVTKFLETCQNVSNSVHKKTSSGVLEVVDCEVSSPPLSHPVEGGQMVEVAGVEPASLVLSYVASTCLALNLLSSLNRL